MARAVRAVAIARLVIVARKTEPGDAAAFGQDEEWQGRSDAWPSPRVCDGAKNGSW